MKRLTIATDCFLPRWDGISRFLDELIPRLEDSYEIRVLAPTFKGEFDEYLHTEVTRFPSTGIKVADYFVPKPSYGIIKKKIDDADIVFVQTTGLIGIMAIIAAVRRNKKIVAYIHAIEWELFPKSITAPSPIRWLVHKSSSFIAKYLYNKCSLLLVPSQGVADTLEKKGIHTKKKVLRLGTNPKLFSPPNRKEEAKKAVGLDPEKLVIGFAGRIGREKDLPTLYRAFGRVNRKHKALLFIGGQDFAGVTKTFTSPKVKLMGSTGNMVKYLQAMDIYVLPSLTETSSLSTMEAMSCQLAVIATPVGSVKEYIKDGFNGLLFEKGNAYDLSKKLDLLLTDAILRKRLGENARRTIIDRFTWDKTAEELKQVFDSL